MGERSPIRTHARVLIASLVGTGVEFYDFYVYATAAAVVLGPLFFPAENPAAQQMAAFLTFGLAFLARPVGAIAFGHFGDRIGRKATLVAALLTMGISTVLIGLLPTYVMAGILAPALLCFLRFGQGLGLGGEWGGAALLATENAPPGWRARFGAAPQLGAPIGFLAANGLFLLLGTLLSDGDFKSWGWRIPFVASAVLVALGLWIRLRVSETAAFRGAAEAPVAVPIGTVLARYPWPLLLASAGVVACFATFYLGTAFSLSYATASRGFDRETVLLVQLAANCFLALGIIVAAILSDRFSARTMLAAGALLTIPGALVFGPIMGSGGLGAMFLVLAWFAWIMGFTYGPLGGWLSTLFPVRVRYTAIGLAFTIGGIVGGALTPIAATAMANEGRIGEVGYLLVACAVLTLIGALAARPLRDAERETE